MVLCKYSGHSESVRCLAVLPDDNSLASGSYDGTIRIWDVHSGIQQRVCEIEDRNTRAIHYKGVVFEETVSAMLVLDNGIIIAGGLGGFVRVWDSKTG